MIFAHHFDFRDEITLQGEYGSSFSNDTCDTYKKVIVVIESFNFSLLDELSLQSNWDHMSGQEIRYLSNLPFEKSNENFTWALDIKNVMTLIWDAENQNIIYIKSKNYTPNRLRFWIYHTFFPLVLELKQKYHILHVGSVEIEGKPILFSAPSFGGKSTLTDYFIRQGHTMLSDDTMAIDKRKDTYYAIASYPYHRPYREVETLGYNVENFSIEPKPLHAIYILEASEPDIKIEITKIKGIEKFKAFYYSSFIDFDFMKLRRFTFFKEMVKHVPAYKVKIPWDLKRLDEIYEAIIAMKI